MSATLADVHLRIEAEVNDGRITNAYSSCTMWRGVEQVLVGRDPRDAWAFTQRLCGVCTMVHAYASVRAVEDALGIEIPALAQAFRNLMIASQNVHDHTMRFYHLHAPDWVNAPNALQADPKRTSELAQSLSTWPNSSPGYFKDLLEKLNRSVSTGQPGIFANAYRDHPAYKLPPEMNLLGVAHYFEALDWQRHVIRVLTLLGGKDPHSNFLVGGVPFSVNLSSPAAVNAELLAEIKSHIEQIQEFIRKVYIPDLLAVAGFYKEWFSIGAGVGNYMSYGELPEGKTKDASRMFLPRGAILDRNLAEVMDVDPEDPREVWESAAPSWHAHDKGSQAFLHPYEGKTSAKRTGPKPPYGHLDVSQKGSWRKSPRWKGNPMEVGPLARMLVAYAKGHAGVKEKVDTVLRHFDAPPAALFSTLGRTAARGIEAWLLSEYLDTLYQRIIDLIDTGNTTTFNAAHWDPKTWPKSCQGSGQMEAPRGSLGHWVTIRNEKIEHYRIMVPSTWNAGPRDASGHPGPYEAALAGTPVHDPEEPVEILRTVHSFDPCLACACHVHGAQGGTIVRVKAQ